MFRIPVIDVPAQRNRVSWSRADGYRLRAGNGVGVSSNDLIAEPVMALIRTASGKELSAIKWHIKGGIKAIVIYGDNISLKEPKKRVKNALGDIQ